MGLGPVVGVPCGVTGETSAAEVAEGIINGVVVAIMVLVLVALVAMVIASSTMATAITAAEILHIFEFEFLTKGVKGVDKR